MESKNKETESDNEGCVETYEPDTHFEPVVSLPLIDPVTLEEDESTLLKFRAKLYRYDSGETPAMWKERGTGDVKILLHNIKKTARIVMRRDKTLKICANHFITSDMKLCKPSTNKKKNWWIWTAATDFADEIAKSEIFAIKFSNEENANLWKEKFIEAQEILQEESTFNKENEKNSSSSESFDENSPVKKRLEKESTEVSESLDKLKLSK
ncbi:ran-specific GTPase-activating protein-like [Planococcus citri]|uniref:ran-specific GTPase-activating protein-like n=1 Tax=Planococcus citri TaxID=170843 RepID=UPI0031FA2D21